ncbi:class I SAM-dependent methyltransferase [Kribbia dieselivorans]|uniref:class I SAM-dependent methyltransferase n=1 Tax=Kribbia dieselivorans TaxID=331526 RepID=UPI0008393E9D|nr:class I SAM-dependent methyltransferase [Kribbia dieselivorans]
MSAPVVRVGADWLALREPVDGAARSTELASAVARVVAHHRHQVVHDLGSGTGSMGRWLAPRLPGRQHWVLHDRDTDLLDVAAADPPIVDGVAVGVETRRDDLTRLGAADLAGATLITASALLDMLTFDELERVVAGCVEAGCPSLITLSVTGRVRLTPPEPLDRRIESAFNAHQRRRAGERALLGPDAVTIAADLARDRGAQVRMVASPWHLGASCAGLTHAWLTGWLDAAAAQEPTLTEALPDYAARRRAHLADTRLRVVVDHLDLLILPPR